MYEKVIKRIIDIVLSGLGIVFAAIPMAAVAVIFSDNKVQVHANGCSQ